MHYPIKYRAGIFVSGQLNQIFFFHGPSYPPHEYDGLLIIRHERRSLSAIELVGQVYLKQVLVSRARCNCVFRNAAAPYAVEFCTSHYYLFQCVFHDISVCFLIILFSAIKKPLMFLDWETSEVGNMLWLETYGLFLFHLPFSRFPFSLKCQSSLGEHAYDEHLS